MTTTSKIDIQKISRSKLADIDFENIGFGKHFSDHMYVVDFYDEGWHDERIVPYGKLELDPSASVLHYGQSVFEGLKAYRNEQGNIVSFRPDAHLRRMNKSLERMCMACLPEEVYMEGLKQLVKLDKDWVPSQEGYALYIRPFVIATDEYIGVAPSSGYKFMIITAPVAKYYSGVLKVRVEREYVRASEGGVGYAKTGGNYAAQLYPTRKAQQEGYHQLLWTDNKEHKYIEECGTMNVMFVIDDTLITAPHSTSILPGVTRDSVLAVAREWGMKTEERKLGVDELQDALEKGTLQEVFGTGTAATIAPIGLVGIDGKDYEAPQLDDQTFAMKINKYLDDIKMGRIADKYGWVHKIA